MKAIEYAIIILLIFSGLVIYPFMSPYLPQPRTDEDPTVVALDVNSFALEAVRQGEKNPTEVALNKVNETARELASKGYIVIKADSVLAAPEGYLLSATGKGD